MSQVLSRSGSLDLGGAETIVLDVSHDPREFYKSCRELLVIDGFLDDIVANAKVVAAGARFDVRFGTLNEHRMHHWDSPAVLPAHLFDETTLCAVIAGLVTRRPCGERIGDMDIDGTTFFTRTYPVSLLWLPVRRGWCVASLSHDPNLVNDRGTSVCIPSS